MCRHIWRKRRNQVTDHQCRGIVPYVEIYVEELLGDLINQWVGIVDDDDDNQ